MPYYARKIETKNGKYRYLPLSSHLAFVASSAVERVINFQYEREIIPAALAAGITHDFGKYTDFFQSYLCIEKKEGKEANHAFISGLLGAYLSEQLGISEEMRLVVFLSIARHHQNLIEPDEYLVPKRELSNIEEIDFDKQVRFKSLIKQIENLEKNIDKISTSLKIASRRTEWLLRKKGIDISYRLSNLNWKEILINFFQKWPDIVGKLYFTNKNIKRKSNRGDFQVDIYFNTLLVYSAIIDSDKLHAARMKEIGRSNIPANAVDVFRKNSFRKPENEVDQVRDSLYKAVLEQISSAPLDQKIFTITAPTGAGKTLAGLSAALWLRERLMKKYKYTPRIIYALPFTSIIDQTHEVCERVFEQALSISEGKLPSSVVLKHHHLAELTYKKGEEDENELKESEALLLIESWQSEIIITTFIQFFYTLVGYKNRILKKFNRLLNSIVILDEVQNIPVEYWPLIEEILKKACEYFNMRVILMTATQPEWFSKDSVYELGGKKEEIVARFNSLSRVKLNIDIKPRTIEEVASMFLEKYNSRNSYLIILNTIKSSIEFFKYLNEKASLSVPVFYLSTNIVPAHRKDRLRKIKKALNSGEKVVVVSTQVVEAGVDLDFDEVWRDIAPVDSIVQASGRCNRNFRNKKGGTVNVFHLISEKSERTVASYVYGKIHTFTAKEIFKNKKIIRESEFFSIVMDYFKKVRENVSVEESERILEAIKKLMFDGKKKESTSATKYVSDFKLIKELPFMVDVFICVDKLAEEVYEYYRKNVLNEKDVRKKMEKYSMIKKEFQNYIIAVPIDSLIHKLAFDSSLPVVSIDVLPEFYDLETGFKRVDTHNCWVI